MGWTSLALRDVNAFGHYELQVLLMQINELLICMTIEFPAIAATFFYCEVELALTEQFPSEIVHETEV